MTGKREMLCLCLLATMPCATAQAQTHTIRLNTNSDQVARWTVFEVSGGRIKSAPAVNNGIEYWGKLPSITIPFTNCDGWWRARRHFHIPVGATNIVLKITGLAVDDRAVIVLNHARITSVGTNSKGAGQMQFRDPGKNQNYNFQFIAGKVSLIDTTDAKPGLNVLKVIVNNTNEGIHGGIVPINQDSPSGFGIEATVTYTP